MSHERVAITTYPMHGQHKLLAEGYRTRDGHMIEWFGQLLGERGTVAVLSRPEPLPLAVKYRLNRAATAPNTKSFSSTSLRIPNLKDPRRWWVDSLRSYRGFVGEIPTPVVSWNPFLAISNAWVPIVASGQPIAFDLLDDWTLHYAFASVRAEVTRAYARFFAAATTVTANAEGTLDLAHRFGRTDAVLLTNGCDPQRFNGKSRAHGPMTVGYVGKIGKRLDLESILAAADRLPAVSFVFAGPILDAEYREPLASRSNVTLLGDVHYKDVPSLLQEFDLGWVPHRVGEGEVGGDVIKTYEYRAAGLPVLTSPVAGASSRGLDQVYVIDGADHAGWIEEKALRGARLPRVMTPIPAEATWENKARSILNGLGVAESL